MKTSLIIFCLILFATQVQSQQFTSGSPEWFVDMFFNKNEFPEKSNYFVGEMLNYADDPTVGEELNGAGEISFHQIKATADEIVFTIQVEQEQEVIDFYCYLLNLESNWKISAVRRFLLPSFIYAVRDSLSQLNSLTTNDSTFFLSLQLFTASDHDLKNYLKINQNQFQELTLAFINNLKDQADKILASVGCNAIYTDGKYPGCIFIQILNFEDMAVGFIQAADPILVPEISDEDFIFIEEVVPGWFIYRII